MANLRGAPPWVQVQPTDFSGALLKGFQTGLSLAEMQNKVAESNAERAAAAQRQAEAAALSEWETMQRMDLEREKLAQQMAIEQAQQGALEQWQQGQLESRALANAIDMAQAKETARYHEGLLNKPSEPKIHFGEGGQVLRANPDGTVEVLKEGVAKRTPQTPEEANRKSILMKQEADLRGKLDDAWDLALAADTEGYKTAVPALNSLIRQYENVAGALTNAPAASTIPGTNRLERLSGVNPSTSPTVATNRVTTKAQFDALPSGTIYIGSDGRRYRKP